jgi:hypothetical protein
MQRPVLIAEKVSDLGIAPIVSTVTPEDLPEPITSWIPGMRTDIAGSYLVLHHTGDMRRYLEAGGDPAKAWIHFLTYDSGVIDPMWNKDRFLERCEKLKKMGYRRIVGVDFSSWANMPIAVQLMNYYKSAVVNRDLVKNGFRVLPNVCFGHPMMHLVGVTMWQSAGVWLLDNNHFAGVGMFCGNRLREGFEIAVQHHGKQFIEYGNKAMFGGVFCPSRVSVLHHYSRVIRSRSKVPS